MQTHLSMSIWRYVLMLSTNQYHTQQSINLYAKSITIIMSNVSARHFLLARNLLRKRKSFPTNANGSVQQMLNVYIFQQPTMPHHAFLFYSLSEFQHASVTTWGDESQQNTAPVNDLVPRRVSSGLWECCSHNSGTEKRHSAPTRYYLDDLSLSQNSFAAHNANLVRKPLLNVQPKR